MSNMFNSIKTDLLSRRMMPAFILLGVALLAALAFALLGGRTKSAQPLATATPNAPVAIVPGPAVSAAQPSTNKAVSETTSGVSHQHGSSARDPFTPLPETAAEKKANATESAGTGSGGSSESTTTETSTSTSTTSSSPTPAKATAPSKPKPKKPVYKTTVQFGPVPTPEASSPLTTYKDLKRLQPLPSSQDPRIAFMGVSASGKGAIFSLVSEAILHGSGVCLPSPSQCEAIDLGVGKSEELEYFEADGQLVLYRLQVQSIVKSEQSATTARKANAVVSAAGRRLVGSGQVLGLVHLRYSAANGVLVLLNGRHAFGAKAHAARRHAH